MSKIAEALTRTLQGPRTLPLSLEVDTPHRYIIFSDQHKGAKDDADQFQECEPTYAAALTHYRQQAFTVVLLGDVEELWEQGFRKVERTYKHLLELEGSFGPGRYYRVWGNHDMYWRKYKNVRKKLLPYMPTGAVYEAIRMTVRRQGTDLGTLHLVHGHQGTFESDKIWRISRLFLRYIYAPIAQRLLKWGKAATPAEEYCLREEHDRKMYDWAARQSRLALIAGHTHRPVWSSRTHLDKLEAELEKLEQAQPRDEAAIADKKQEIIDRRERTGVCDEAVAKVPNQKPCYFNTGCCRFRGGTITGLELEDGTLRLIKWTLKAADGTVTGTPRRVVLEEEKVSVVLGKL